MDKKIADRIGDFVELAYEECRIVYDNKELMNWLGDNGFFTSPASTKYHGVYPGGLYDHSYAVYRRLAELTARNDLKWQRPESPFIVGMFHDLCKCDQYVLSRDETALNMITGVSGEIVYKHNEKTLLKGHGSKSVMLLSHLITLTEEEMLCIRYHMGAYEKEEWQEFDMAIRKYPNVLWTSHADMLASKVDNI